MPALDAFDIRILTLLQHDSTLSMTALSARVGRSASPCWRRIQRLREEGYIKAEVAILDRSKLGYPLKIFAQLKMRQGDDSERAAFNRAAENIPEVLECCTVFGGFDVLLVILAPDMHWYEMFCFSTLLKLPGVQDLRSIVTTAETKCTTIMPLSAGAPTGYDSIPLAAGRGASSCSARVRRSSSR
ncbi:MAG TPA: Lrp/AsnC family transcriptional regulator [Caulobacteraceae bacterium]|jgi:Lrp/AsnC family transcriptional regulator|nr:Lrp/AsnC family transcriptional regulator [Caulobacteraceae bacterium]